MAIRVAVVAEQGILGGDARGVSIDSRQFQRRINEVLSRWDGATGPSIQVATLAAPVSSETNHHMGTVLGLFAVVSLQLDADTVARFDEEEALEAEGITLEECPHGHGRLRLWQGKPRCWTCGFPAKKTAAPGAAID